MTILKRNLFLVFILKFWKRTTKKWLEVYQTIPVAQAKKNKKLINCCLIYMLKLIRYHNLVKGIIKIIKINGGLNLASMLLVWNRIIHKELSKNTLWDKIQQRQLKIESSQISCLLSMVHLRHGGMNQIWPKWIKLLIKTTNIKNKYIRLKYYNMKE